MSRHTRRLALAACTLLVSAALPATRADDPPPPAAAPAVPKTLATPAAPEMSVPPADTDPIDPQVKTLLDQVIAAQTALTSCSATLRTQTTGGGESPVTRTTTLTFQKPSRAKVIVRDASGPLVEIVSDGKTLSLSDMHSHRYVSQPAPAAPGSLLAVLGQSRSLIAQTLAQPSFLGELLTEPGVTVALGSPNTLDGVAVDTITVTPPDKNGGKVAITLSVGHDDHLLRQVAQSITVTQGGKTQTFGMTETVTQLTVNPTLTAADFRFVAPPGAKKTASLEPPRYDPRLKPRARPFALAAKDLSGKPLTLSQYKGKVVLMDFWATWCGPCVEEMPTVIAAYKKYHGQGFDVVGISLDQDKSALKSFVAQNKMPWRQVFDGKGWSSAVPRQYGVSSIPFGLLLNRDGTIAAVSVRGDALPAAIKAALAKK